MEGHQARHKTKHNAIAEGILLGSIHVGVFNQNKNSSPKVPTRSNKDMNQLVVKEFCLNLWPDNAQCKRTKGSGPAQYAL